METEQTIAITKGSLAVAKLASGDSFHRALTCVHVTPKYLEASDGHLAGRVTHVDQLTHDGIDMLLDGAGVEAWSKLLPAAREGEHAAPELRMNGKATLAVGAVSAELQPSEVAEARNFPDLDQVWPTYEPDVTLGINPELLIRALQAAQALLGDKGKGVTITLRAPRGRTGQVQPGEAAIDPIKITATNPKSGQVGEFIVMPMRL